MPGLKPYYEALFTDQVERILDETKLRYLCYLKSVNVKDESVQIAIDLKGSKHSVIMQFEFPFYTDTMEIETLETLGEIPEGIIDKLQNIFSGKLFILRSALLN